MAELVITSNFALVRDQVGRVSVEVCYTPCKFSIFAGLHICVRFANRFFQKTRGQSSIKTGCVSA
jgi:hypothetical protein